ncbi:MAG: decaprenyl-phosphate phosphoribosyltransferase [Anaerolineae bacterium]
MLLHLLRAMRPKQWAKNAFLLPALFFDGRFFDPPSLVRVLAALVLFCGISSAIYLINDLVDMEKDRQHPDKRHRPLASGALAPATAAVAALLLLAVCLPLAFALEVGLGLTAVLYVALMLAYDYWLKHVVILDMMTISAGFVLRVHAGAVVAHVSRFSPWLYVCATLLALFIAVNKRRHELILLAENANNHRSILDQYTVEFLDDVTSLVTAAVLVSYSFYTFSTPVDAGTHRMMLTIPFVFYALLRYLYLVRTKQSGGAPEDIVLGDGPLIAAVLLWAATAGAVIYFGYK